MVREAAPRLTVCLSSQVHPECREYERTSTTVINASLVPVVNRYLDQLEKHLAPYSKRASDHAVQRRHDDFRDGAPAPDVHGGIGAGGGRAGGRADGGRNRAGQRAVLRHGRDHREGLPDPERPAAGKGRRRGRRRRCGGGGARHRPCAARADVGYRRGRRRWRQYRVDRQRRCVARRADQLGRRAGTRMLCARRHGAHGDRRQRGAGLHEPRDHRRRHFAHRSAVGRRRDPKAHRDGHSACP